ncbi:MAG: type IV pilus assembly protein PilM [Tissierellia bacterium]|nr:type IV pilus assembly protein PilM [Tissierellia bacterium]
MLIPFVLKRKVLSIDIGAHTIKVVEGSSNQQGIKINNYFTIRTPANSIVDGIIMDKDLLHYILSEELSKGKTKAKNVILTINSSKIITREIQIPKVKYDVIDKLLKFQIEDYLPVKIDDYVVQFKIIDQYYVDEVGKMKILVIAMPKGLIDDYYELIINLRLNPLVLDYQPNSISKLLKSNNIVNDSFPLNNLTLASIDIGHDTTKISIIKDGKILVTKIIDIGGNYIEKRISSLDNPKNNLADFNAYIRHINSIYTDDSEESDLLRMIKSIISSITEKIEVVFRYYLTRDTKNKIDMILLSGGMANINGLDKLFSNVFNIPTVTIESLDNVNFQGPIIDYANAIGSMLRTAEV